MTFKRTGVFETLNIGKNRPFVEGTEIKLVEPIIYIHRSLNGKEYGVFDHDKKWWTKSKVMSDAAAIQAYNEDQFGRNCILKNDVILYYVEDGHHSQDYFYYNLADQKPSPQKLFGAQIDADFFRNNPDCYIRIKD